MRKKGIAFDRKRDIREKNWAQLQHEAKVFNNSAEKNFFKGETWQHRYEHPTQHDESDDLEEAKRVMIEKALFNKVDNA